MDRNTNFLPASLFDLSSLSARRAWIEIKCSLVLVFTNFVALRKESVDRNLDAVQIVIVVMRRSPQGERG